jgi:hypothetical protein
MVVACLKKIARKKRSQWVDACFEEMDEELEPLPEDTNPYPRKTRFISLARRG